MAQLFGPAANTVSRLVLVAIPTVPILLVLGTYGIMHTSYVTGQDVVPRQPVPFSHKHHVGDDGIDCRYCHISVAVSRFAGLPPTETCMTCHSQLWTQASVLAPVRESLATERPIRWQRVNRLPGYVYFDHSIHVAKGVGCTTCHGPIASMPLTWQAESLTMGWCLDCHRNPAPNLRPLQSIYDPYWSAPSDQERWGRELMAAYRIKPASLLTDCSTCHR
ncbi:MAG: cytochrome c3 family protein [Geminicoccaceae bacterium]